VNHPKDSYVKFKYWENPEQLFAAGTVHLGLADLKQKMEFEEDQFNSYEEAEGARKLVERFAFEMGVHGRQIVEDEVNE
jgi:hypothetical protein